MSDVYRLGSVDPSPLNLATAKTYLKVTSTSDDVIIQSMIDSATEWGEKYTGRAFRIKTWTLLLDTFPARIVINRDPVESVTSVRHLVSDVLVTVDSAIYYLKKLTQCSEILLLSGQSWPTNTDRREQSVEVIFKTESYHCTAEILEALQRHVSYLYSNRGDCADTKTSSDFAGITLMYDQFRISRI